VDKEGKNVTVIRCRFFLFFLPLYPTLSQWFEKWCRPGVGHLSRHHAVGVVGGEEESWALLCWCVSVLIGAVCARVHNTHKHLLVHVVAQHVANVVRADHLQKARLITGSHTYIAAQPGRVLTPSHTGMACASTLCCACSAKTLHVFLIPLVRVSIVIGRSPHTSSEGSRAMTHKECARVRVVSVYRIDT
jgi:hypothetical protein